MMLFIKNKNIAGQTIVEVLIATSILVLVFAGAAIVIFGNKSQLTDKKLAFQAENYSFEGLEAIKTIAKRDWTLVTPGDHGIIFQNNEWELSGSSTQSGIFTRIINCSSTEDDSVKTIKSTVTWSIADSPRNFSLPLTLRLTDWQGVLNSGGDTGGGGTIPDWANPATLGSVDLGPGVSGEDLDTISKIVYLVGTASDNKKNDFFVVDATNGQSPFIVSSIDTGPGLVSIDATGDYAYVAQKDSTKQLQIIDTTNQNSPTTTANFSLPGIGGSGAKGLSIFYQTNKAYVGTEIANGPEFHIVDVTDKQNPASLGSKEISANVNGIFIKGKYAYLATADGNEELKVYNISIPSNITYVSGYNATGTLAGASLYIVGNKLYLGRLGDNNTSNNEFLILDISDVNSIKVLGSKELGADLNDLRVRDNLAFLGTADSNKEFQVYNISDPNNITLVSSFNFPQVAHGVDFESNLVYVAVRSNDSLRIITSQQ